MKCEYCEREFVGERSTAKYCSSVCRVRASREVSVTKKVSVTENGVPEEVSVTEPLNVTQVNLVTDLKLNLEKDLGIYAWTKDGIFIRPDITIEQVRNIRALVGAKNGWEPREYRD